MKLNQNFVSSYQEEAFQATKGRNPLSKNQRSTSVVYSVLEKTGEIKDFDLFSNNI